MKRLVPLAAALVVPACTSKEEADTTNGPIVSTIGMISDVAGVIVGDKREVINIIGEATDPHGYVATKGDIDTVQSASLVLYNGHFLEGKMATLLSERENAHAVAENLKSVELLDGDEGHADPHLWMDISVWSKVAGNIGEQIIALDPENEETYRNNLTTDREEPTLLNESSIRAPS